MKINNKKVEAVKAAFGSAETMSIPTYNKLAKLLDSADNGTLSALVLSNIKFVSKLAENRLIRRGVIA